MAKKVNMKPTKWKHPETGKVYNLLNPAQKAKKYSVELKHNRALTNELVRKTTKSGNPKCLSNDARAYRAGYLDARKDSAGCYNAKRAKKK